MIVGYISALELSNLERSGTCQISKEPRDGVVCEALVKLQALAEAIAVAERQSETAYARTLAVSLWRKHYEQEAPQWQPFDDLLGLLTQIDNMTTGLVRAQPSRARVLPARHCGSGMIDAIEDFAPVPAVDASKEAE